MREILLAIILTSAGLAQTAPQLIQPIQPFRRETVQSSRGEDRLYTASVIALVGANVLDHTSSIGHYERNPFLQDANGRYHTQKAIWIKSGAIGGLLVMQHYAIKRDRKLKLLMGAANITLAAWFGSIATVNFTRQ